jgi:hypothetical protein
VPSIRTVRRQGVSDAGGRRRGNLRSQEVVVIQGVHRLVAQGRIEGYEGSARASNVRPMPNSQGIFQIVVHFEDRSLVAASVTVVGS